LTTKLVWSSFSAHGISRALLLLCCAAAITAGVVASVHAEDPSPRKLITRVTPRYPEYLREHEIGGVVRLTVVVTPGGNVKSVTPIGGNPILITAAIDAVKQWKYAPSDRVDSLEVKVDFIPSQH
jgi:TonB family protein